MITDYIIFTAIRRQRRSLRSAFALIFVLLSLAALIYVASIASVVFERTHSFHAD